MTQSQIVQDHSRSLSLSLAMLGGFAGLALGYGVLSGDAQGQVNLLFLLLLFVVLPLLALVFSLILLIRPGGRGLVGWLLELPFWSTAWRREFLQRELSGDRKTWLVYQTQFFSLGFSAGGLLVYLLLLLATDISFIWRSTLLEAEQLLPLLNVIALPWRFWGEAQASLALLEQTRDFRLLPADQSANVVGLWWRYVLAAQICYSLLPRSVMLILARIALHRQQATSPMAGDANDSPRPARAAPALAELLGELPTSARVLDWSGMPDSVQQSLRARLTPVGKVEPVRPDSDYHTLPATGDDSAIVVVVKAWEPPLAELADFLVTIPNAGGASRLLLPLDWNGRGLQPLKTTHLNEWRRFAATLSGWKVAQMAVPAASGKLHS